MKALIFDLDDTLYDQVIPFSLSIEKNFSFCNNVDIIKLFKDFRYYSDKVFSNTINGYISKKQMQVYRIKEALHYNNYEITTIEAINFQSDYEYFQGLITLPDSFKNFFDYCKDINIFLGVITNGLPKHQKNKIIQLNLNKWIRNDRILISGNTKYSKPDSRIFSDFAAIHELDLSETYYIGDSYHTDIVGATSAGWNSIWLNRRNWTINNTSITPNHTVYNENSLLHLLRSLV